MTIDIVMDDKQNRKLRIKIPFINKQHAMITYDVISVDEELKGSGVKRNITLDGLDLILDFEGIDLKKARTSLNICIKNIQLIFKTFECFSLK